MPNILASYVYGHFSISFSSSLSLTLSLWGLLLLFFFALLFAFLVLLSVQILQLYLRAVSFSLSALSFFHLVSWCVTACAAAVVTETTTTRTVLTTATTMMCDLLQSRLLLWPFVCVCALLPCSLFLHFHIIYWFLSGLELQIFVTCQTKDTKYDHQATAKQTAR